MKESEVERQAQAFFKEKCKITPKKVRLSKGGGIPDIVGVSENGEVYVVECKAGEISHPLHGVGQLTRYRVAIEKNPLEEFKRALKTAAKDRKVLLERIPHIQKPKLRYYLAVPKKRSKKLAKILKRYLRRLGFTIKEYENIWVCKQKY